MKQWYETLFENYGRKYDSESFTQGTMGVCDFIEREIGYNKSIKSWISGAEQGGTPLNYLNEATILLAYP